MDVLKIIVLFELHFTVCVMRRDNDFMSLHIPRHALDGIGDSDSSSQTSSDTSSSCDSSSDSSSSRSNTQSTESSTSQTSDSSWSSSHSPNYKVVGVIPSYLSFPTSEMSSDSDSSSDSTKSCSDNSHTPTPAPPPSKVELGYVCSQYPYCKDPNAECRRDGRYQNMVCTCRHGWHFVKTYGTGGICTPDTCEDTGCPSSMVCRDGKCEAGCPPRTIYVNGECRFDQWGEACVCSPDTCVEADTECQDGYCDCKVPGLEYSHYLNMCVGQNYGDPCSTYQDTCDKHIRLQCINGECKCPHGTRPVGDPAICCDDCSHGQECCLDGVGCRLGKCHCKHDAVVFGSIKVCCKSGITKVCCDDCSKIPNSHCCTQLEEEDGKCHAGECRCDFEEASRYPHVCCPNCTSTLAKCCVSGDIDCVGQEGECVCIFESTETNPEHCCPDCPRGFYCTESGACEKRSPYSAQCGGQGAQYPENSCSNEVGIACQSFIECDVPGLPSCDMKFCICDWTKGWRLNGEGCCNDNNLEHACSNDVTLEDTGSGDVEVNYFDYSGDEEMSWN